MKLIAIRLKGGAYRSRLWAVLDYKSHLVNCVIYSDSNYRAMYPLFLKAMEDLEKVKDGMLSLCDSRGISIYKINKIDGKIVDENITEGKKGKN